MTALDDFDWKAVAAELDEDGRFRATVDMDVTASAKASTGTSTTRCPTSWPGCERRSGPICCRSPATGRIGSDGPTSGPTTSRSGSNSVTGPVRPVRRRCCCGTPPEDGTRYIATCTAIWYFPLQVVVGLDEPGTDSNTLGLISHEAA